MNNTLIIDPLMNYEQTLLSVHNYTAVPSIIFLWSFSLIIFLLSGLAIMDKQKSNMMKFFGMWIIFAIFTGIVVLWLCYSPNSVQAMKYFFVNFFK